jgi:hypothetical protein
LHMKWIKTRFTQINQKMQQFHKFVTWRLAQQVSVASSSIWQTTTNSTATTTLQQ